MSKLIRFDEDHFGYLIDHDIEPDAARRMYELFQAGYAGKHLIIMQADEFVDLTGQFEIVPIPDGVAA